MPDAGWYRDPQDPSSEEYWDGQSWSGQRRPSTVHDQGLDDQGLGAPTNVQPVYRQQARPAQDHGQSGYGQSGYGQSGSAQSTYGRAGFGQAGFGEASHGHANYAGSSPQQHPYGGYTPPAARKKRRKLPWVVAAVLVVLIAAGVVTYFVRPDNSPSITYRGKEIASADTVLTTAQKSVSALVKRDHGNQRGDTRCYFVQSRKVAKGARASDVTDSLRCGPVLFVDGKQAAEYLPVPLIAKNSSDSGGKAELTPDTSSLQDTALQAVPRTVKLVRPDGATPPAGSGGLSVPQPPPAQKDSILATDLGSTPDPKRLSNAAMIAKNQEVRLIAAGRISHYGTGVDERSAPAGQELIAFQIEGGDGAVDGGGVAQPLLVVDGQTRQIPSASGEQWDVASVPTGSTPMIQLTASGYTQTLSLPDGTPGAKNIAVLTRGHTLGLIGREFDVSSKFSKNGASVNYRLSVSVTGANLYFWPPSHPGAHPSDPGSAFLSIGISYTRSGSSDTFGFPVNTLHLKLPDGSVVTPHNIAGGQRIYNVFTVPANYTDGTLTVGGSGDAGGGIKQTLAKSKSFQIHIHAN